MDSIGGRYFAPLPSVDSTAAATDGDDSGDEAGARKGSRRSSFRSLGVAAHDAWVSQNEGSVEAGIEQVSSVTAAEGEQAADGEGDQSAGGERGRDTRAGALLSQARKKWSERFREAPDPEDTAHRMRVILDAAQGALPLATGSRYAMQLQVVSRLLRLAEQIVAARACGQQTLVAKSLNDLEWQAVKQVGPRPGLKEVALALQELALQSWAAGRSPGTSEIDNALLPLQLLQSLAPQYKAKRGISISIQQAQKHRRPRRRNSRPHWLEEDEFREPFLIPV